MKALIFSSVGDRALAVDDLVRLSREEEFDLAVAYYGSLPAERLRTASRWFRMECGGKFQNFVKFIARQPQALSEYDYVLVPDDDIRFDARMLRRLISVTRHFDLNVSSFAHSWSGKISAIKHMMQADHKSGVDLTNFVEMTCPLLNTSVIDSFLAAFRPVADVLTGWGADFVISSSCWSQLNPIGVFHGESVRNALDRERPGGKREIESIQPAHYREHAWEAIARRFSINHRSQIYSQSPDPTIYCIHLKRARERHEEIQNGWVDTHGISVDWIDAVDRRHIDLTNTPLPYYPERARHVIRRELTDAEIACAISHIIAMKRALEFCGPEGAVIMEDDSRPLDNAREIFDRIRNALEEFPELEVIKCDQPYNSFETRLEGSLCHKLRTAPWGAALTWYSREAMVEAIRQLETMTKPADWPLKTFAARGVMGLLDPAVATHPGETSYLCHDFPGQKREPRP